jgi:hypothetical protein
MDGAGSIGIGVRWNTGVWIQRLWVDGSLQYLVFNERPSAIEVLLPFLPAQRSVPAKGMRTIDAGMIALDSTISFRDVALADGTPLGNLFEPRWPVFDGRAVINNEGLNGGPFGSLYEDLAQLESDFIEVPGRSFTVTLALHPGSPTVVLRSQNSDSLAFGALEIVAARSPTATIRANENGFIIAGTPKRDDGFLTKVDVDVVVPESFVGPFILFEATFCQGSTAASDALGAAACSLSGSSPLRAFPVDPARL